MSYSPDTVFYVNSVNKSESREAKNKDQNSVSFNLVDDKKKNQSEKNWTPMSYLCMTLCDETEVGLEFGKKYKITFEEVK